MSDIAATSLGLVEESTPGVTPASPVFELQNISGLPSIDGTLQTVENPDLRTDLNITGVTPTGQQAGGGWPFAYRFNGIKTPLRGAHGANYAVTPVREKTALAANVGAVVAGGSPGYNVLTSAGTEQNSGTPPAGAIVLATGFGVAGNNGLKITGISSTATFWDVGALSAEATPPVGARLKVVGFVANTGDISAAGAGTGYAGKLVSAGAFDFTLWGLMPGDPVKIGGTAAGARFGNVAANNDVCIVASVTALELRFSEVPAGWGVDNGAGKAIRLWLFDTLTNGVVKKTFTARETATDIGPEYAVTRGYLPASVALSAPQAALVTGTVGGIAMVQDPETTTAIAGATELPAAVGQVLNGANTVSQLRIDGAVASGSDFVTQIDLTFERFEAERIGGLFVYGAAGLNLKRFRVTGSYRGYYKQTTGAQVRAKAKAATPFTLTLVLVDPAGPDGARAEGCYLPSAQYTSAPKQDQNGARGITANFTAGVHTTLGFASRWFRAYYLEL